jgi:hypothetical protein
MRIVEKFVVAELFEGIPFLVWDMGVHYRVYKSSPLDQSQMNSVLMVIKCFYKIYCNYPTAYA